MGTANLTAKAGGLRRVLFRSIHDSYHPQLAKFLSNTMKEYVNRRNLES